LKIHGKQSIIHNYIRANVNAADFDFNKAKFLGFLLK